MNLNPDITPIARKAFFWSVATVKNSPIWKTPENAKINDRSALLLILAICAITYWPLLFNRGAYWDSLMAESWFVYHRWDRLRQWSFDAGVPLNYYYGRFLTILPIDLQISANIATLFCFIISAFCVYFLARAFNRSENESLIIALLATTYPAFQCISMLGVSAYIFYLTLFLVASLTALKKSSLIGHLAAAVLFFLSFGLNSLLVFFAGFLVLLWARYRSWRFVIAYSVIPVTFWCIKTTFFQNAGLYTGYNSVHFSAPQFASCFSQTINNAIFAQYDTAQANVSEDSVLSVIYPLMFLITSYLAWRGWFQVEKRSWLIYVILSLFLLVLAVVPYALVDKFSHITGVGTRHSILIRFAVALFAAGCAGLIRIRVATVALAAVISLSACSMIASQFDELRQTAINESIMLYLKEHPTNYSVYWVNDNSRGYYEWASMFETVYGDETRVGLDSGMKDYYAKHGISAMVVADGSKYDFAHQPQGSLVRAYNLEAFNPNGKQCTFTVQPKAFSVWSYMASEHCSKRNPFLRSITDCEISDSSSSLLLSQSPSEPGCGLRQSTHNLLRSTLNTAYPADLSKSK